MAELGAPCYPRTAHPGRPLVWLTSYPKSGNTWMRILLSHFLDDARQDGPIVPIGLISADRHTFDNATGLTSTDMTAEEIDLLRPGMYRHLASQPRPGPLFIKAHDAFQRNAAGASLFPEDVSRGAILIVRHPMDVALSLAHHLGDSDSEHAARRLGARSHVMGGLSRPQFHQRAFGWSGHYLSWTRQDVIPVLVIRYEDMLADTQAALVRILDFLAIPGAENRERVARAAALSQFDRLQEIEDRLGFGEIPVHSDRFFRSGRAGEGIEQLPPHLKEIILRDHAAVMAELGYTEHGAGPLEEK